jgi:DNA-binding transcriptional regulator YdaS (Cro superfamily)
MRTQDAINHYGSQTALAEALGIKQSSVAEWGDYPPKLRQIQIEVITARQLQAEPDCFPSPREQAA